MTPALAVADAVEIIAAERGDAIAVLTMSGLGVWPEHRPEDFRLVGLMGGAASIGLGLALGRPERDVWVIDGDGSLLMQLGVLGAVADAAPRRLLHVVIANGVYAISGGQAVPGSPSWDALALAAGYRSATVCSDGDALREALRVMSPGPRMVAVHCADRRPEFRAGAFEVDPLEEARRVQATLQVSSVA
ncbi:MAG: phosphonopyruvate decarboxylase [Solirubrobacterales bacterium]|nr:phosphonopyruvate decarboxylase [Solirubrobacterales bacterium]